MRSTWKVLADSLTCLKLSRTDDVLTMGDVAAVLSKHFKPEHLPDLAIVDNALDFKSFLGPYLNSDISGHTGMTALANTGGPRAFKFERMKDGNVGMRYREFAGDDTQWLGVRLKTDSEVDVGPWPVFKALPPFGATINPCADSVRMPITLHDDIKTLVKWLSGSDAICGAAESRSNVTQSAVSWLRSVLETKSIVTEPAGDAVGVGVGQLRTVVSAMSGERFAVRHIADASFFFDRSSFGAPELQPPRDEAKRPGLAVAAQTLVLVKRLPEPLQPERKHSSEEKQRADEGRSDSAVKQIASDSVVDSSKSEHCKCTGDTTVALSASPEIFNVGAKVIVSFPPTGIRSSGNVWNGEVLAVTDGASGKRCTVQFRETGETIADIDPALMTLKRPDSPRQRKLARALAVLAT